MTASRSHGIQVGAFVFDRETGELHNGGSVETLRPQAARLLDHLASRPGRLVSRQELTDQIWPGGRLDADLGLNACVAQARAALADDAKDPGYIQTLRGRGYRLVAPVEPIPEKQPGRRFGIFPRTHTAVSLLIATTLAVPTAWIFVGSGIEHFRGTNPAPRVAVLPYRSIPHADSLRYIEEGLSEDLITAFAAVDPARLAVITRTSSFGLSDRGLDAAAIADTLAADYVLCGTIRATGSGYRLTTRLLDARTGTYVWSDFRDFSSGVPVRIDPWIVPPVLDALSIVHEAERHPDPNAAPGNPVVRNALLRSRFLRARFTRDASRRALDLLQAAEDSVPGNAEVLAEMAAHHLIRGEIDAATERLHQADDLDGGEASVQHVSGRVALYGRSDPETAVRFLERAVALRPGDAGVHHDLAQALVGTGRVARAAEHGARALELDPVSSTVRGDVGWVFYYARQYASARGTCHSTLLLLPDSESARACILLAAHAEGALVEETETLDALLAGLGANVERRRELIGAVRAGNETRLWDWLLEFDAGPTRLNPIDGARVLALLERPAEAAARLAAADLDPAALRFARQDPVFERVRGLPDFERALKNAGIEASGS